MNEVNKIRVTVAASWAGKIHATVVQVLFMQVTVARETLCTRCLGPIVNAERDIPA
jgi:hypothetical protein